MKPTAKSAPKRTRGGNIKKPSKENEALNGSKGFVVDEKELQARYLSKVFIDLKLSVMTILV